MFHKAILRHMEDLEGVEAYIHDLLTHAPTKELHDARVNTVRARCRKINLNLSVDRRVFSQTTVTFLGHRVSGMG